MFESKKIFLFIFITSSLVSQNLDLIKKGTFKLPLKYSTKVKEELLKRKKEELLRPREVYPETLTLFYPETLSYIEKLFLIRSPDETLKQFGYDFFKNRYYKEYLLNQQVFQVNFSVPYNYILKPGDEITVYIWGENIFRSVVSQVDASGGAYLEEGGYIKIAGLTYSKVKKLIRNIFNKRYSNVNVEVVVSSLHNIKVYVIGEVENPGGYILGTMSTLIDALILSGGVKKSGSLRNIKIIKRSGVVRYCDLYKLFSRFRARDNPFLDNGDIIVVPVIKKVVGIKGGVNKPGIYEIKNKTTLWDILKIAGGVNFISSVKNIVVERKTQNGEFKCIKVSEKDFKRFLLKDGDLIIVNKMGRVYSQYVSISGNVRYPGRYSYYKEMVLKDLISDAGGLLEGTYKKYAHLYRWKSDSLYKIIKINLDDPKYLNLKLKPRDSVYIYSYNEVYKYANIFIFGDVDSSGEYPYFEDMTVKDAILMAGGVRNIYDTVEIEVLQIKNNEIEKKSFKGNLMELPDYSLFPGCLINVRVKNASFGDKKVYIGGEVRYPGHFALMKGETLKDLLEKAGGLTVNGDFANIRIFRVDYEKKKEYEHILDDLKTKLVRLQIERYFVDTLRQKIKLYPESMDSLAYLIDSLEKIYKEKKFYYEVGVNIKEISNFRPLPGDSIIIYPLDDVVYVKGEVYSPRAVKWRKGEGIKYYIKCAGGYNRNADKGKTYIIKSSGIVDNNDEIRPGDTIVVPPKAKEKLLLEKLTVWAQLLSALSTTLLVVYNVLK